MSFRVAPRVSTVSIRESGLYNLLGQGLTDQIILVGHADGLPLNNPYPVRSMRDTVQVLGKNVDSPLLKGMLEAYHGGARDMWLVAAAPMSEYELDIANRDETYYQAYLSRLEETFHLMDEWDVGQIIIPLEAPFNSTVDFLYPLINHCVRYYQNTGRIHIGLLGTRGQILPSAVDALVNDPRLTAFENYGKFAAIFAGDVVFNLNELPFTHTSSVVTHAAGVMAQLPYDRGLTYHKLKGVIGPAHPDLPPSTVQALAEAGINLVGHTTLGRRGVPFETVIFTDNTLMPDDGFNAFWSLAQMRLISVISSYIQALGRQHIGNITFDIFKNTLEEYFASLVAASFIRNYSLEVYRLPTERNKVFVHVTVAPYVGLRELSLDLQVGPYLG